MVVAIIRQYLTPYEKELCMKIEENGQILKLKYMYLDFFHFLMLVFIQNYVKV